MKEAFILFEWHHIVRVAEELSSVSTRKDLLDDLLTKSFCKWFGAKEFTSKAYTQSCTEHKVKKYTFGFRCSTFLLVKLCASIFAEYLSIWGRACRWSFTCGMVQTCLSFNVIMRKCNCKSSLSGSQMEFFFYLSSVCVPCGRGISIVSLSHLTSLWGCHLHSNSLSKPHSLLRSLCISLLVPSACFSSTNLFRNSIMTYCTPLLLHFSCPFARTPFK